MSYLISLNPMLFKNIAHVGSFKHFVFVYLRICVFVYFTLDMHILESHAFQKYMLGRFTFTLEFEEFEKFEEKKWPCAGSLLDHDKH